MWRRSEIISVVRRLKLTSEKHRNLECPFDVSDREFKGSPMWEVGWLFSHLPRHPCKLKQSKLLDLARVGVTGEGQRWGGKRIWENECHAQWHMASEQDISSTPARFFSWPTWYSEPVIRGQINHSLEQEFLLQICGLEEEYSGRKRLPWQQKYLIGISLPFELFKDVYSHIWSKNKMIPFLISI